MSDENLTPLVPPTPSEKPPADTPCTVGKSPPVSSSEKETPKKAKEETTGVKPAVSLPPLTRTRCGRMIKPPRNPDFKGLLLSIDCVFQEDCVSMNFKD